MMKDTFFSSVRWLGLMAALVLFVKTPVMAETVYQAGVLDFPPFYVVKSETQVEGSMADLLRSIMDKAGIAYELKGFPPKRLYKNLAEGTTQIWMGIKGVPEFEGMVLNSDIPVTEIEIRVYSKEGTPPIAAIPDFNGKKIITIRGFGYGGLIAYLENPANQVSTDPSDSHELAFKKLIKGRGDYVLDYKKPAEEALKASNIIGLNHTVLKNIKVHLIISKQAPDAENLLKKLEEAYLELKKEGKVL